MKHTKHAIILLLIVLLIVVNFLSPLSSVQASSATPQSMAAGPSPAVQDPIKKFQPNVLDYLLGIPLYLVKVLFIVPGLLGNLILSGIANTGGATGIVTLEDIFFNKIALTNIDFFSAINENSSMGEISRNIAIFYVALRNLAIALSLLMLVYIGIQMAINSSAEAQAKYKQMLTNWFVGFGIIFILHFFMIGVIKINNQIIQILDNPSGKTGNFMSDLLAQTWDIPFTTSLASRSNVYNFNFLYI